MTASLVKVLGFLLAEGMENVDHYKMVVLRERGPWEPAGSRGRRGRNRGGAGSITAMETYLCFWCLSASTCFSEIDKQVHSIVLTSGERAWDGKQGHRPDGGRIVRVACRCQDEQCVFTFWGESGARSLVPPPTYSGFGVIFNFSAYEETGLVAVL